MLVSVQSNSPFLFLYFCRPRPPLSLYFLWAQRVGRPEATEAVVRGKWAPLLAEPGTVAQSRRARAETTEAAILPAPCRWQPIVSIGGKNITCEVGVTKTVSRNESRHEKRVLRARLDK